MPVVVEVAQKVVAGAVEEGTCSQGGSGRGCASGRGSGSHSGHGRGSVSGEVEGWARLGGCGASTVECVAPSWWWSRRRHW